MGTQPPREGTPKDGEPLWVDADWWREMLGTRDKGMTPDPGTPSTAERGGGADPDLLADLPTAPQPAWDGGSPPSSDVRAVPHEAGVDGPPVQAPVEPPPVATWPAVLPAATKSGHAAAPDQSLSMTHPEAPVAAGAPAPPAVPRAKRAYRAVEPSPPARETRIPRVSEPAAPDAGPTRAPAARTLLPPRPEAKVASAPVSPPQAYVPPMGGRPRLLDFFLRHLGDLALFLLAAGVIALVYLVLGS